MSLDTKMDRNNKKPLYQQLYEILKGAIENGEIKEGEHFFSESELEKKYSVSKVTVRNAMRMLENHGYIRRSQGASTIVRSNKNFSWNLSELTYDLKKDSANMKSVILSITKMLPDDKLRSILRLSNDDKFIYRIDRIRSIDGRKINRSISHLVPWVGVDFTKIDFNEDSSIYEILDAVSEKPVMCDESLEAIIGDKENCELLELPECSPLFYRERTSYDEKKHPVEFVQSYYNAKYAKYYVTGRSID